MNFEQQLYYWMHMLDEAMGDKCILTEGKHWPQDYEKTFINQIKASNVYQNIYYKNDEILMTDVHNFILDIDPHAYEEGRRVDNTLLSYFSTLCRWFIEKSINLTQYQQFMEVQLPECIRRLKALDKTEEKLMREKLKSGSYENFIKLTDEALDKVEKADAEKMTGFQSKDNGYQLIKIDSYEQLNRMFGGTKTGAAKGGTAGWCHTNGRSTYDSWINNGKNQFVILCKKNWEDIKPTPEKGVAFDDYGTSVIALLVNKTIGKLVKATLRYNHVISPPNGLVDNAVTGYGELSQIAGFDVKQKIKEMLNVKDVEYPKYSGNPDDYKVGDKIYFKYEDDYIPWIILDKKDGNLVIQSEYALEKQQFDENGLNIWRDSSLRKYMNSNEFMSKLDDELLKHVKTTKISTGSSDGQIITDDKFWLLSQENIGYNKDFLIKSDDSQFKFFQNNKNLRRIFAEGTPCYQWLRSASSCDFVGYVNRSGYVNDDIANNSYGVLPACELYARLKT